MKIYHIILYAALFFTRVFTFETTAFQQYSLQGYSFLSPRSQSTDAARELVGWREFINRGDICGFYSAFSTMFMYQQSYRGYRIAEYFFGSNTLRIVGSQNPNPQSNTILADYFGLSPAFSSTVVLDPTIINGIIDFDWYLGYDDWYFRVHAPVVWSKTTFKINEEIDETGSTTPFPALYMADGMVQPAALSFSDAISQQLTYGQVTQGLHYGRIACRQNTMNLSDVQIALGYNVVADDIHHAGFNFRLSIPTGNRSQARFLLEPIVGNGHHFEAGVGFSGHWIVWEKDTHQNLGVYLDINMTHLFASRQVRSFDFIKRNDPCDDYNFGSRYILMKEFDAAGNYNGTTIPALNRTTLACKSHYNFELDMALMLGYSSCWVDLDFGYSPWIRSKEHLKLCQSIPANTFGLKGIQNVALAPGVPSNATQTITASLTGDTFDQQALVVDVPSPQFVSAADIDICSASAPTAFTHKIFWNISHAWKDEECYNTTPFFGFGGEFEFESLNPRYRTEPNKNSVSMWSVWLKGGVAF